MSELRLEDLIQTYGDRVRRLVRPLFACAGEVEDVCQETWMRVWEARTRLAPDGVPWTYVRRVALSRAVDRMRRRSRTAMPGLGEDPVAPTPSRGDHSQLLAALERLQRHERDALLLHFWGGLSVAEIARRLEVADGTIKTWMRRGRERLRSEMESQR